MSHVFEVERLPDCVTCEEHFGLAVVDDVLSVAWIELLQDGDDNSAVGDGAYEHNYPARRVLAY